MKPGLTAGFAEDVVMEDANGNRFVGTNWVLTDEEFEQVRQGYRCINCMEPFQTPFPDTCLVCFFPVKREQLVKLEREHQGEQHYGPTPDHVLDDRAGEQAERDNWTKTDSNILIPRAI